MKVLFASGYNPFQAGSGPGNGLFHLSQALAAIGCEVHILTQKTKDTGSLGSRVILHYYQDPLKKTPFSKSWIPFSLISTKQIGQLCRSLGIDIVNGRSPTTFAYSMLREKQFPFVVSAHGTSFGEIASIYSTPVHSSNRAMLFEAGITQPTWTCLTLLEYQCASRVVAVSKSVAEELNSYYHVDKEKIVVIPNGVRAVQVKETEQGQLILSVGRTIWRKGFRYLLQAMPSVLQTYPKAKLVIVGEGPYKPCLIDYTRELHIEQSVEFLNNLPREKLFQLYAKAQVYIQPSLYEPLGNTVLEAMVSEKPVIASRVGGITEIISDQTNGVLVDPRSSSQLAEAIKTLLSDSSYRKKLGRNAKVSVERDFSWESVANKTLKLYEELVY